MISLASTFPAALAKGLVRPITLEAVSAQRMAWCVFFSDKGNDDTEMAFFAFFYLELKEILQRKLKMLKRRTIDKENALSFLEESS